MNTGSVIGTFQSATYCNFTTASLWNNQTISINANSNRLVMANMDLTQLNIGNDLAYCAWYVWITGPIDQCWIPQFYWDYFIVNMTGKSVTNYVQVLDMSYLKGYQPSTFESIMTKIFGNQSLYLLTLYTLTGVISILFILTGLLRCIIRFA
jgi:hypothetical protein